MDALKKCIEAIEGYEKELGMTKTPLAKAGRAELAALEAVVELIEKPSRDEIMALVMVAEAARTGVGLDDALDKLDALKEAGKS